MAVALPPLALAAAGLSHPSSLTDDTAMHWRDLHIALLPVFPLLAIAPILLTRRHDRRLGILAVVLGFAYAVCYQALDILAGIAAGALKLEGGQGVTTMYALADGIVVTGVWSYVAVTVLASALVIRHAGLRALPGAVIAVIAAVSFVDSHIFFPRGVITMLGLAIGWTWLALASCGSARRGRAAATRSGAPAADRAEAAA
ncbi:membrane protein [Clavibacter michiganensis subsp. insidiosus]|uniref:Membrane protein n=1 Tax=Clavibacter michiganensis subsp. insidiosus TaxID=33014 RepID=A0A0D5CLJ6_9MICO|nr:membrane protein [Clavibacter michiganensis subsp. insidiosus]